MTPIRMTQATALVLHAVTTGHAHGFEIMEVTGLASGTVYPVLRRLEREGALESAWEEEGDARAAGRPRRRLYAVTPRGERYAELARRRLENARRLLMGPGGPEGWAGASAGE